MNQAIKSAIRTLLFFIIILFSLPADAQRATYPPDLPPNRIDPDSSYVIITNWANDMGPHGCVVIPDDYSVKVNLRINLASDDLHNFPPIYLQAHFDQEYGQVLGPVTTDDLTEIRINGTPYYQAEFIVEFDASASCFSGELDLNPLEYGLDIITTAPMQGNSSSNNNAIFLPYPISAHIGTLFSIETFGHRGPDYSNVFVSQKTLCCPPSRMVSSNENNSYIDDSSISNTNGENGHTNSVEQTINTSFSNEVQINVSSIKKVENISFQPNPFSQEITIAFNQDDYLDNTLRIYSTSGELVFSKQLSQGDIDQNRISISLEHLSNGVYWCAMGEMTPKKIIKLLP